MTFSEEDIRTARWDVTELLGTPGEIAAYLEACLEEANGDAGLITGVLADIARAKGMTLIAQELGISRERLYKALDHGSKLDMDIIRRILAVHQAAESEMQAK